jgi:ankyrin repeat protein
MQTLLKCSGSRIPHDCIARLSTPLLRQAAKRNSNSPITRVFSACLNPQANHLRSLMPLNKPQVRTYSSKSETEIPQQISIEDRIFFTCMTPTTPPLPLYKFEGRLALPKDIDANGMQKAIKELVKHRDKEALKDLIRLLRHENIFPNMIKVGTIGGFSITSWPWEVNIRDELIEKRDLELIKEIFPLFNNKTRLHTHVFYDPIKKGDLELVQALVEGGMQPLGSPLHSKNNHSSGDVLLYSIFLKELEITRYLLKSANYDINTAYSFSIQCAERKVQFGFYGVRDCITPAYLAVLMNDPKLLETLIGLGADCNEPNIRFEFSDTCHKADHPVDNPLTCSIKKGYYECFYVLLEKNINLNCRGANGETPLLIAMKNGKFLMGQALIAKGADVNAYDESNVTAIMLAVQASDMPTIQALLKTGADPWCVNGLKNNLWHHAARSSRPEETCELLRECGIQDIIDNENKFGVTPLFAAIENNNPLAAFRILWGCGADINKKLGDQPRYLPFAKAILQKMLFLHREHPHEASYSRRIKEIKIIISILENGP